MKVLWVKAGRLLPLDTGGKIRSYNILHHLAKQNEVTLLTYYGGRREPQYEASLSQHFPGAHTIHTAVPEGLLGQSLDYIWNLSSRAPYAVKKFTDPAVQHLVTEWLNEKRFDVAVCDFLSASLNFPNQPKIPSVLFQHNVESVLWRRMAQTETMLVRRLSYRIEAAKMLRYETYALGKFHHVIAVSERDRDEMLKLDARSLITVVPTGVDTEKYKVSPPAVADPPVVVFTGSMDWEPNIDAVEYFCREIWPSILIAFPNARFQIVGRNPHPRVQRLKNTSVEITGMVPNVADYLRSATVVVVPLRTGGGTRLKIFEAMAMGKALVSTSIGAEGLDVKHGQDLMLSDSPESFSASVQQLLREPDLRWTYEKAAATLAARYDWSEIASVFMHVLRESIAQFQVR